MNLNLESKLPSVTEKTADEDSVEAFKRLYESISDNQEWPDGYVPKADNKKSALKTVAHESLRLLGYDIGMTLRHPIQRISGQYPDEYIWQRFSQTELDGALTMCARGELKYSELGSALTALRIPKAA